jgi:hypothetical protein
MRCSNLKCEGTGKPTIKDTWTKPDVDVLKRNKRSWCPVCFLVLNVPVGAKAPRHNHGNR